MDNKVPFKLGQGGAELGAGGGQSHSQQFHSHEMRPPAGTSLIHTFMSIVISFIPT